MGKLVIIMIFLLQIGILTRSYAQPTFIWGQQIGTEKFENGRNVKTDPQGNPILVGSTEGSLYGSNLGGIDGFIVKFDQNGNTLWKHQFGTDKDDRVVCMDVANNGNIVVSGNTGEHLRLGNNGFVNSDIFVYQFDSDGNRTKSLIFRTDSMDYVRRIRFDHSNNIVISGDTKGKLGKKSFGDIDCFIIKLDSSGHELFRVQFGTQKLDLPFGLAVDKNSNIYLGGYTKGDLPGKLLGNWDAFITKYSSQGKRIWIKQYGASGVGAEIRQLYVDSVGFIYATGKCSGNYAGINKGKSDVLVMKLNNKGDVLWKKQFGTDSYDFSQDMIYAKGKGIVIGGSLHFTSYVRMYNFQGDLLWNYIFGEKGSSSSYGMGIYQDKYLYIAGSSFGNLFKQNPNNKKNGDAYIIKIELNE